MKGKVLVGRYEIVDRLGSGGFGETFLANDAHLPGKPICVVKKLQPLKNDPAILTLARQLFDKEAATLYKLGEFDRIPRLLAHFEYEGEFYLVQQYISGHPLSQEIRYGNKLGEDKVINILRDVLEVLVFVHKNNIIHRDIKPSNLICRQKDCRIVVIDFGAIKQINTATQGEDTKTIIIGSPEYMPSEQANGYPQFSSDLYALGITCLQALTGLPPRQFPRDADTNEYSSSLCAQQVGIKLSDELAKFLDKLICYDYRQRYANAEIALNALEKIYDTHDLAPTLPFSSEKPTSSRIEIVTINQQKYRDRRIIINKVYNFWIKGVLETSLHGKARIILGLENCPDLLATPWSIHLEAPTGIRASIAPGTEPIQIFDQLGTGATLLILGEPGSGKTMTLLGITRELLNRAETKLELPIPVVFNLSSWQSGQSLSNWLLEELNDKYQVPKSIGRDFLENRGLQLMLDGLDEVNEIIRDECVESINKFCQQSGGIEIIVCSRIKDYENLSKKLKFQGAILIQKLTDYQIKDYFDQMGDHLMGIREIVAINSQIRDMARSPLMLSIMTIAYWDKPLAELIQITDKNDHIDHLFNAYLSGMLQRYPSKNYSREQTQKWLSWLARYMTKKSQTIFQIEQLQGDYLPDLIQTYYTIIAKIIIVAIVTGFLFAFYLNFLMSIADHGVRYYFTFGFLPLDIFILILVSTIYVVYQFDKKITPVNRISWSWKLARHGTFWGQLWGILLGVLWATGSIAIPSQFASFNLLAIRFFAHGYLIARLVYCLLISQTIGFFLGGLAGGISAEAIADNTRPNEGIWRTLTRILWFSSFILLWGVILVIIVPSYSQAKRGFVLFSMIGLAYLTGLIDWLITCARHLILRIAIYFSKCGPWNFGKFLNYANQCILMQKVGGSYIFIHRSLLEYLARL